MHQQAGAAAALLLSPCEALANEFDVLNEAKPSSNYIIDDANVLNKTTRKTVNDQLSRLEVGFQGPFCCMLVPACLRADLAPPENLLPTYRAASTYAVTVLPW